MNDGPRRMIREVVGECLDLVATGGELPTTAAGLRRHIAALEASEKQLATTLALVRRALRDGVLYEDGDIITEMDRAIDSARAAGVLP